MLKNKLLTLLQILLGSTLIILAFLDIFNFFLPNALSVIAGFLILTDGLNNLDKK